MSANNSPGFSSVRTTRTARRNKEQKKTQWLKRFHYHQIPSGGRNRVTVGHTSLTKTTFQKRGETSSPPQKTSMAVPPLYSTTVSWG
jgi:hypothetical protein